MEFMSASNELEVGLVVYAAIWNWSGWPPIAALFAGLGAIFAGMPLAAGIWNWWRMRDPIHVSFLVPGRDRYPLCYWPIQHPTQELTPGALEIPQGNHVVILRWTSTLDLEIKEMMWHLEGSRPLPEIHPEAVFIRRVDRDSAGSTFLTDWHGAIHRSDPTAMPKHVSAGVWYISGLKVDSNDPFKGDLVSSFLIQRRFLGGRREVEVRLPIEVTTRKMNADT
jgi:hypothetical protein